ncbi:MAG: hypothetical protein IPG53_22495 [Ignavibacteriales bacterium]|nr:hypothetical protein [Ignavibacteriales bacterium]
MHALLPGNPALIEFAVKMAEIESSNSQNRPSEKIEEINQPGAPAVEETSTPKKRIHRV